MSKNKTNLVLTSFIYIFPQDIEKGNKFSLLCTLMLFNVINKWRAFWKLNSLHGCNKLSCLTNLLSTLRYSVAYWYITQKLQYPVWWQKLLVAPWVAVPPSLPKLCPPPPPSWQLRRAGYHMNVEKKYIVIKFLKQKLKIQFIHEDLRISFYSINLFWQKL